MLATKVTTKYQATIPQKIRNFMHLKKGDKVSFEIDSDKVVISRVKSSEYEYLSSLGDTLNEWSLKEDEEAYDSL